MVTEKGVTLARDAEGVLQFCTRRQDRRYSKGQLHWVWSITARATDGEFLTLKDAHHRIIAANVNITIVQQEGIGQGCQAIQCIVIVRGDGFFAKVATGHDEWLVVSCWLLVVGK